MAGGMHGARDMSGNVVQQGWHACGLEVTTVAEPERTWARIEAGG